MDPTGRDVGLRRVSRLTRWSIAGAVLLSGAFSALVAHARPGVAKASSRGTAPTTSIAPASGSPFLEPPITGAPTSASGAGVVTSGAS